MATVPAWHVAGDWFDICSCDIPCPCEFAQAPTNTACEGMLAWHIRKGRFGEVKLDGFNLLGLGAFFASLVVIPQWLQTSLGYTATWAGYATAWNGVAMKKSFPPRATYVSSAASSWGKKSVRGPATIRTAASSGTWPHSR